MNKKKYYFYSNLIKKNISYNIFMRFELLPFSKVEGRRQQPKAEWPIVMFFKSYFVAWIGRAPHMRQPRSDFLPHYIHTAAFVWHYKLQLPCKSGDIEKKISADGWWRSHTKICGQCEFQFPLSSRCIKSHKKISTKSITDTGSKRKPSLSIY